MKVSRITKGSWGKVKAFFDLEVDGLTIKGYKKRRRISRHYLCY